VCGRSGRKLTSQKTNHSLRSAQFAPYCHFGCDLKKRFDGTLFRFPLRNNTTAAESEISKTVYDKKKIDEMVMGFESAIPKMLLFLRHVQRVEVYMEEVSERSGGLG